MKGTYPYCRTKEAIKRLIDGDIIQNIDIGLYFKMEQNIVYQSTNLATWKTFNKPLAIFPPYDEWKSITNLHYFNDLDVSSDKCLFYLSEDENVLPYGHKHADINKKRWFISNK